jgi:hypothetical protein
MFVTGWDCLNAVQSAVSLFHFVVCSGVARFLGAWSGYSYWPPLTEIRNLRNRSYLLNLLIFGPSIENLLGAEAQIFH